MAKWKVGGVKKAGRNKIACEAYFRTGRRAKNKRKKLEKHIVKHPNDSVAAIALNRV